MEANPQLFPWAHFPAALRRFQSVVAEALSEDDVRSLLIGVDASGCGFVPFRRFHVRSQSDR